MSKVLLLQGNQAVVEGAIAAGVKFFAGYPITPSTEVAESLAGLFVKAGAYRLCLRCGNSSSNC